MNEQATDNTPTMDDSDWAWAAFAYSTMQFDKSLYISLIEKFHREVELYLEFKSLI